MTGGRAGCITLNCPAAGHGGAQVGHGAAIPPYLAVARRRGVTEGETGRSRRVARGGTNRPAALTRASSTADGVTTKGWEGLAISPAEAAIGLQGLTN